MKERTKFVLEWERRWNEAEGGRINMAELCRGWDVRWGAIPLGHLDEHHPDRGLIVPRRRRGAKEVSGMCLIEVSRMFEG